MIVKSSMVARTLNRQARNSHTRQECHSTSFPTGKLMSSTWQTVCMVAAEADLCDCHALTQWQGWYAHACVTLALASAHQASQYPLECPYSHDKHDTPDKHGHQTRQQCSKPTGIRNRAEDSATHVRGSVAVGLVGGGWGQVEEVEMVMVGMVEAVQDWAGWERDTVARERGSWGAEEEGTATREGWREASEGRRGGRCGRGSQMQVSR